jgi:hypothetical protein
MDHDYSRGLALQTGDQTLDELDELSQAQSVESSSEAAASEVSAARGGSSIRFLLRQLV